MPSTVFTGVGPAVVAAVGHELDSKVGRLLEALGVVVPEQLSD